jgi:glycosyltransferase involved in cell wall biosynthesis
MKIGVDAREIQDGVVTGIGRSLANFIRYFGEQETRHTLILFSEKSIPLEFQGNVTQVVIQRCPVFLWDQLRLPKALRLNQIDLFYSPYYKVPLMTRVPVVNQILDLMFLSFPPYRRALGFWGRWYYATFGRACAWKAVGIITDSEHAKSDIMRIWGIDSKKIIVIPLGVADRYVPVKDRNLVREVRTRLSLPEQYILYLGNFKPHKNVTSLVKAYKRLLPRFPDYKLVLAGPLDKHGLTIQNLVSREGLDDRVIFTGTIREEDNPEVMLSMADVFVFPTLYEGFGLPPLEAMACGTPVIASNLTAVPEVIGDAGMMVNPLDIDELSMAMESLLGNGEKRDLFSQRGRLRSRDFSEKETAGNIYHYLIDLLEDVP